MQPHDTFLELCALSTAGDLSEEEHKKLQAHLSVCPECRQALKDFEAAVDIGIPLLSSKLDDFSVDHGRTSQPPPAESALPQVSRFEMAGAEAVDPVGANQRSFAFAHRNGRRTAGVNWAYVWMPFAACIVLSIALASYAYRTGKSRRIEVVTAPSATAAARMEALESQISDEDHKRQVLQGQVEARDRTITELRRRIGRQSASLAELNAAQAALEQSVASDESERNEMAAEEASIEQKLDTSETSINNMKAALIAAEQQRADGDARSESLRAQILDLNGELRDRELTINKQDDLLSHDRDIRDLMGARDLYIAEVYDVGRDGATEKPCGRVFYTKGKSLIFYAYDLDQQAGVQRTTTFQAWGRRGADMQQALNLGIFYEDNAAKKRWVLKVDNAKTLDQIDAVFVTVQPHGESNKPSGKPLLFAYLKIDPNHP